MQLKRARFRIKTFILCKSQNGYVWFMIIHLGKGTKFDKDYTILLQQTQIMISNDMSYQQGLLPDN